VNGLAQLLNQFAQTRCHRYLRTFSINGLRQKTERRLQREIPLPYFQRRPRATLNWQSFDACLKRRHAVTIESE